MASSWPPKKNTEFTLDFTLYKNDGTVIANPGAYTKKISKDGGAVANITASVTEEDTTYGQLSIVLSATEMNADRIWIQIKDDTTGCVAYTATIYTAGETLDEVKAETAAIKAKTDNLPADPADDSDIDAQLAAIAGYLDTEVAAILAAVDTEVAAIKAKTDNLPANTSTDLAACKAILDILKIIAANKSIENEAGTSITYRNDADSANAGTRSWTEATKTRGAYTPS